MRDIDLQEGHGGKQGGEYVDGVGDVDEAGGCVLKSRPRLQVGRVNVHQQHPQNHLAIGNTNPYFRGNLFFFMESADVGDHY